ncbi:hypothetical protein [Cellulomonas sp. Y8]|uniref:hypothetical protein n=1 Tax=Cellulomonas sp. Y8 TaxID=2591145 RepID=UPI0011C87085|nr:hypothetical protein [Cellulomonas sp. Y8]
MARNDAKMQTVEVLTTNGVLFCPGGRTPLDPEDAARVYELLVDAEAVLAPPPGAGGPAAVDEAWIRDRDRGEDARTLTLVVLTSRAVLQCGQPLAVDEALCVYELLVTEHRVLVPGRGTFLPEQWVQARACR